ncbi:winged helix-turn-helix transcriptional regulator [Sphingomonas sp. RS2018]
MESEKITKEGKRWYDDACGTAMALEFVGERWSLLILREMMFGGRRFGELRANLPGISANILTQRLEGLEANGMVTKRRLPSPVNAQVYELTPWGYEIEPMLQTMGRWATRSRRHDPTLFFSPASAMLSLRTMLPHDRDVPDMRIAFRFPDDAFAASLTPAGLDVVRGELDDADMTFTCAPSTLAAIVYVKWPLGEAEAAGALTFSGDRTLAQRFIDLFALPEQIAD